MEYKATITIPPKKAKYIKRVTQIEPKDFNDFSQNYPNEDETYTETVMFPNGAEIDVKLCGVQWDDYSSNKAWTEAILYENNSETVSEPEDDFFGEWWFYADNDTYLVNVIEEN